MSTKELDIAGIVDMPAGHEIDILIAEHVFGLVPCTDPVGRCEAAQMKPPLCYGTGGGGSDLRGYSRWLDAAWSVVEHMRPEPSDLCGWTHFSLALEEEGGKQRWRASARGYKATADTPELAICRAALFYTLMNR